ncbi:hypothetical protein CPI84_08190 [Erwinia pyrifoliae]|nr:hypothetical protein CPI84_08190 [Erwinia pyrifoliae]
MMTLYHASRASRDKGFSKFVISRLCENSKNTTLKWFTEFGHLNRGDMLTSEQHRCSNEKKKF